MKTNKYFMIPILALLACSCQDNEEIGGIRPTPGEEVKLGGSLENIDTRTIYGEEAGGAFPIYWVNGDQVQVFSPECANAATSGGIGKATVYKVSVDGTEQAYATSMDKTGEEGLRWGDNDTGNFYSVYPASSNVAVDNDLTSVQLTIPQQDNTVKEENGIKKVYPNMNNCFMVAATKDVTNGQAVDLHYKPLSTAVRFNVVGPSSGDPVGIQYARLYAPDGTYLTGTFTANFTNADTNSDALPTVSPVSGRAFNYATMNAAYENGTYITIDPNEEVEFCLYFLLEKETVITNDWYIEIATTDNVRFQKNLTTLVDANQKTLVPGQVHRLPDLPALDNTGEWDPANWMSNIQRNVYLSEISIPGSWNSLNTDFQGARANIALQYAAGVRAFHFDTRWRGTKTLFGFLNEVVDLGVVDTDDNAFRESSVTGDRYMDTNAPSFADALKQITDEVKDDEYMVVICTFAQGSAVHDDWRKAISDACAANDKVKDARELSENSVVADVLGKVIVIVNTYTEGEVSESPCFYFNMGMTLNQGEFTGQDYYKVPMLKNNITNSGITIYGTHAQITTDKNSYNDDDRGYVPSLTEREGKAQNILNWSRGNYADINNYAHNAWIYLGLGGYIPGSGYFGEDRYNDVAQELNNWINGIVTGMDTNSSYYPVGIVLMNDATTYSSVVNNILQLNTKYRKAYDPDRSPVDGAQVGGTSVQSAAPGYSSGMTDSHANAIGW